MGRAMKVTNLLIDTVLASLVDFVLTPLLGCPLLLAPLGRQPAVRYSSSVFFEEPVLFPPVAFVAGEQELFSALDLLPWVFSSAQRGQRTPFQFGRTICVHIAFALFFQSPGWPWCIGVALLLTILWYTAVCLLPVLSCLHGGYVLPLCYALCA